MAQCEILFVGQLLFMTLPELEWEWNENGSGIGMGHSYLL